MAVVRQAQIADVCPRMRCDAVVSPSSNDTVACPLHPWGSQHHHRLVPVSPVVCHGLGMPSGGSRADFEQSADLPFGGSCLTSLVFTQPRSRAWSHGALVRHTVPSPDGRA